MKTKAHWFPDLNLSTILRPADASDKLASCTKVCATVGPACQSVDTLVQMLNDGMSAARIDLTWGPIDYHRRSLDNLQEAMRRTRKLCAIMLDTLGREVMIRRPFRCVAATVGCCVAACCGSGCVGALFVVMPLRARLSARASTPPTQSLRTNKNGHKTAASTPTAGPTRPARRSPSRPASASRSRRAVRSSRGGGGGVRGGRVFKTNRPVQTLLLCFFYTPPKHTTHTHHQQPTTTTNTTNITNQPIKPTKTDVECSSDVFPVTYPRFADMMEPGDNVYLGRYLVSGADSASLYLEVRVGGL
jgi:hypothetical protein